MLTILVTTWQHNLWSSAYFINLLITIAIIWSTTVFAIHHKINNSLVTTNPQLEEQLLWLACHDDLTGIYNRRYFNQQIAIEWERLKRSKTPLALLILDIDYFKQYNDTLGHPAGDNCLKLVAEAIRQTVNRGGDVVARYGGEEFVLLLPNTAEHGAQHIANKLHQAIAALNIASPYPETPSQVTISTGISVMLPTAAGGYDVLLKQADHALYQAKYAGRNCYRFYTEAI